MKNLKSNFTPHVKNTQTWFNDKLSIEILNGNVN